MPSILRFLLALGLGVIATGLKTRSNTRFGSTVFIDPRPISERELFLSTRTSFETTDFLQTILNGAKKNGEIDKTRGVRFTYLSVAGALITLIASPYLQLPDPVANSLGLFAISSPFVSLLLQQYDSEMIGRLSRSNDETEKERICYHEAGHFLAAYLAGITTEDYTIDGSRDSGLSILPDKVITGNALICAMAGCVSESLRFGDCSGGEADIGIALSALDLAGIKKKEQVAYLRWGLLKALSLLRLYRDALDEIALKMNEDADLEELVAIIEDCVLDDDD
jgi:hypothetical protein